MSPHLPSPFEIGTQFDPALVITWAFFVFFGILVYWLRREDKREGYPMIDVSPNGVPIEGLPEMPPVKTYTRLWRGPTTMPHRYGSSRVHARRVLGFPGAPLVPIGDPLLAEVGPGAYPLREDEPLLSDGEPQVRPLRAAEGWRVAEGEADPRGMAVVDHQFDPVGTVVEVWVDRSVKIVRYLEVELAIEAAPRRRVLVPIYYTIINQRGRRVRVMALRVRQFAGVPSTAQPDCITAREEDRINAYYSAGLMFRRSNEWGLPETGEAAGARP